MRTAFHWQPAILAALLTATPLTASAAPDATAPPGTAAPVKPPASPTAAKPTTAQPTGSSAPAAGKSSPPPAGVAKPGTPSAGSAKPGTPPAAAAKPGTPAAAAVKPGTPPAAAAVKSGTPPAAAAKPGTPPAAAVKPGTPPAGAAQQAPSGPLPAGPAKSATATPTAGAPAAVPADPAKAHLPLAQAVAGIKGFGTLIATIELVEVGKPVQELHCELYPDKAPLTVANFVGLARGLRPWKDPKLGQWVKRPLYDGNALHRVIPELLLQGGDPNCTADTECRGAAGIGEPGYSIPDEIRPELRFDRAGRLAMANRGPGTSGSQFFITEREAPWLNGGHTIFGQCDGAELITRLSRLETGSRNQPKSPLTIKRVTFSHKPK